MSSRRLPLVSAFVALPLSLSLIGCSSKASSSPGSGADAALTCAPPDAAVDPNQPTGANASCSSPGEPTKGPADSHCVVDGGLMTQTVSQSSCCVGGDAGGADECPYNATMYGREGDDDDCKYHVTWTSTPLCEGSGGVTFTVVATSLTTKEPVTGAHIHAEVFTTTPPGDGGVVACDDQSTHESPFPFTDYMSEGPPGTYVGRTIFDTSGQWTIRFHLNENCLDVLPDSPHGHAAFHLTIP
jgi:hypothetical protein